VQWVVRPQTDELHDYRGYAGRILSGALKLGDTIKVFPSGIKSTISKIETYEGDHAIAEEGKSITLHLADEIDISRGDMIGEIDRPPIVANEIEADICWMDTRELDTSATYFIQHQSKITRCKIREILYKVNINTLEKVNADTFGLNDIGRVEIKTADELAFDPYQTNKRNGGAIIIDSRTNVTVGALMLRAAL